MPNNARCAVGCCDNDKRYPDYLVTRSHAQKLIFHKWPKDENLADICKKNKRRKAEAMILIPHLVRKKRLCVQAIFHSGKEPQSFEKIKYVFKGLFKRSQHHATLLTQQCYMILDEILSEFKIRPTSSNMVFKRGQHVASNNVLPYINVRSNREHIKVQFTYCASTQYIFTVRGCYKSYISDLLNLIYFHGCCRATLVANVLTTNRNARKHYTLYILYPLRCVKIGML